MLVIANPVFHRVFSLFVALCWDIVSYRVCSWGYARFALFAGFGATTLRGQP
jgi:hypothetical protein